MGTFCLNFHARSKDLAAVATALARIVHVEALVAPPNNDWITFFDENASSQDEKQPVRIARSLSKKLQTPVFAFLVHDSDVFRYHLFDGGKLIDQFDSRPDYFGVISKTKRRKNGPELLLGLARAGVTVEQLQEVLTNKTEFRLEEARAAAFAALFDIDQALAAADYRDADDNRKRFQSVLSNASPLARALTDAVKSKDIAAVRAALERGASPNLTHGFEPLIAKAIRKRSLDLVRVLREFGGKSEYTLEDGTRLESDLSLAVAQAAHSGRMEILDLLLTESVAPTAAALADALCEAVRRGSFDIVERLLEAGADVNLVGPAGSLSLVHAVKRGYSRFTAASPQPTAPSDWDRIVQRLLDAGASVNARQRDGVTPLMSAAWNNELEFVRKLLALGADPNLRLESGLTALLVRGGVTMFQE